MGVRRADADDWSIEDVLDALGWDGYSKRQDRKWVEIRCPFHGERNPSSGFNRVDNIFRCHGCDARGNPVSLVMQQKRLSQADAVRWLEHHVSKDRTEVPGQIGAEMNAPMRGRLKDFW